MGMIDKPDSGRYLFKGEDITNHSERQLTNLRKDNIGFVFQNFNLIDELTVFENVELPFLYIADLSRTERQDKVKAVLEQSLCRGPHLIAIFL